MTVSKLYWRLITLGTCLTHRMYKIHTWNSWLHVSVSTTILQLTPSLCLDLSVTWTFRTGLKLANAFQTNLTIVIRLTGIRQWAPHRPTATNIHMQPPRNRGKPTTRPLPALHHVLRGKPKTWTPKEKNSIGQNKKSTKKKNPPLRFQSTHLSNPPTIFLFHTHT